MKLITETKAMTFTPSTPKASGAAAAFIDAAKEWGANYAATQADLRDFLKANCAVKPQSFLAGDPLNMSVFGVVFESHPGEGFMPVPRAVADRLEGIGLRGSAYFPDLRHPIGKTVMEKMNAISRAAEQRPLLTGVPGVKSVGIENGRVVLSRAELVNGQIQVHAATSAIQPTAEVSPVATSKSSLTTANDTSKDSTPANRAGRRPGL